MVSEHSEDINYCATFKFSFKKNKLHCQHAIHKPMVISHYHC